MKQAVFYLKQHSLLVQTEKQLLGKIDLSEFVKDSVIEDNEAFVLYLKDQCKSFVKKVESSVIILGSGLLYQKAAEKDDKLDPLRKELLELIPFPEGSAQEKIIETPSKNYLLYTNKDFYTALVKALDEMGIETIAVLPLSLFSDEAEDELSKDEVKAILEKERLYETGNFLQKSVEKQERLEKIDDPEEMNDAGIEEGLGKNNESLPFETVSTWNTSRLLLVLGFLVILTIFLGGLIYLQQNHQGLLNLTKPTPTPIASPTPTPTPPVVAKSELSVEVQNGTGTPGQAATVKGLMEGIKYTSITTSNADNTDHEQTEVVFSGRVDDEKQQEIKEVLLKSFSAVTTSVDKSATNDIVITTGTEK